MRATRFLLRQERSILSALSVILDPVMVNTMDYIEQQ
jgi:hypothetical protein